MKQASPKALIRPIQVIVLLFAISSIMFRPTRAAALELPCQECCPATISNMMTDMGMMAYEWADFMGSVCSMMPFIGMFCPQPSQMAGEFFNAVLDDPELTLDMLQCADGNAGMLEFMIDTIDKNPELLDKMAWIMRQENQGCIFTEKFTEMALRHDNLKNFFFAKINDNLYESLTYSMSCATNTTQNMAQLVEENAVSQMQPGTPFVQALMNIGTTDNSNDGNEMANERMFYYMFGDIGSANTFLDAMDKLDPQMQQALFDFIFLGKQNVPAVTCDDPSVPPWECEEQPAAVIQHGAQMYYNLYAIIRGFVEGVAPEYDMQIPPQPDSTNPANALFGRFMGMLIDEQGNMTPYAQSFFSAMVTGAQPPNCDPYSVGFMQMMMGLMEQGFVPFSEEMFMEMMPQLLNQNAPGPRNFIDGSGDSLTYECQAQPQCSGDNPTLCTTVDTCQQAGLNWCDDACQVVDCPVPSLPGDVNNDGVLGLEEVIYVLQKISDL